MEQFEFRQNSSQQNFLPALSSDEQRQLIQCHITEQESRVHCGLRPKLNEHTCSIETVICKCIYRTSSGHDITAFPSWEEWTENPRVDGRIPLPAIAKRAELRC